MTQSLEIVDGKAKARPPYVRHDEDRSLAAVSKSAQAEASSAHSRINIPLNLSNWRERSPEEQELLTWFHQHCLNESLNMKDAATAIGYDNSVVFRVLKGTYEGSWQNVCSRIDGYRKLWFDRASLKRNVFAENRISRLVWGALDYAIAVQGITEIRGESGQGKSIAAREWQERNNHGKTVFVECPPTGGINALLREICQCVGHNRNHSTAQMQEGLLRAFNANRILIIDEASRLLPGQRAVTPVKLEALRYIHDRTGCALGFITTSRFRDSLQKQEYQFEQLLGRIDMPVTLPHEMDQEDFMPLLRQYISEPSSELIDLAKTVTNDGLGGRMRRLGKHLQFASKIANTDKEALTEMHVFKAVRLHQRNCGEQQYAKKK